MGTSTKRPKGKPGQSAGKNGSGKPGANQQASGEAQPAAKAATDASESTSKTTTSSASAATSKAPTSPASAAAANKTTPAPAKPQPPRPQITRRDQKRDQKREEISRKIEERRVQRERELRKRTAKRWAYIGIPSVVVLAGLGVLLYVLFFGPQVAPYLRGATIDGVECNASEQLVSHYHAHLQIYVDGQPVAIPTDVGRQSITGCYYWLHTHPITGDDGVIHIESPDNRTYDVHQFFDIWGQTFTATNFMTHQVDASHKLTVYVYNPTDAPTSGQPFTVTPPSNMTPYTGDPTKIVLKPHELVVLEYGTPVVPPPAFTFIADE